MNTTLKIAVLIMLILAAFHFFSNEFGTALVVVLIQEFEREFYGTPEHAPTPRGAAVHRMITVLDVETTGLDPAVDAVVE